MSSVTNESKQGISISSPTQKTNAEITNSNFIKEDLTQDKKINLEINVPQKCTPAPTYIVTLKLFTKADSSPSSINLNDEKVKKKTALQKEANAFQRKQQIRQYNKLVTQEERQRRYQMRHNVFDGFTELQQCSDNALIRQSPSKRKKVTFES